MKIVPLDKRGKHFCYFCGEHRSVKYVVKVKDHVLDDKPVPVYCCNRCVTLYNDEE